MKQFPLYQDSMTEETLLDSIILFECCLVWHQLVLFYSFTKPLRDFALKCFYLAEDIDRYYVRSPFASH